MTSQDSTDLVRKCTFEQSLDMHCVRGEFGKGDILVADIE